MLTDDVFEAMAPIRELADSAAKEAAQDVVDDPAGNLPSWLSSSSSQLPTEAWKRLQAQPNARMMKVPRAAMRDLSTMRKNPRRASYRKSSSPFASLIFIYYCTYVLKIY